MDTIFAFSTAPGKAGVAVLRISGPKAHAVTQSFAGSLPNPRELRVRSIKDRAGETLDEALVVIFDQGASFTGELSAEWHVHGSTATQSAILSLLGEEPGLRPAEAGEFTRRALENGRLDLTQVEGLADLIDAETEGQRKRALRTLGGSVSEQVNRWRKDLQRAAALLAASIDFADEEVPDDLSQEASDLVRSVRDQLAVDLSGSTARERLREGFEVAIVGPPNVGKSTLLNRMAGRDAAITSEVAGTTRDVIEVRMDIGGMPVTLLDTAGLRDTTDPVEKIGVDRARQRAGDADLQIILFEDQRPEASANQIVLRAKSDITDGDDAGISGKTGDGLDGLLDQIAARLKERVPPGGVADRERHRVAARTAIEALDRALILLKELADQPERAAEDLRIAARALESLIGRIDVEHLLDDIFSSFCIGK